MGDDGKRNARRPEPELRTASADETNESAKLSSTVERTCTLMASWFALQVGQRPPCCECGAHSNRTVYIAGKLISAENLLPFDQQHYVPVLKGKRAEFNALSSLAHKNALTPLIESVPSSGALETPRRMADAWPAEQPYFIDLLFLDDPDDATTPASEGHPVLACFGEASARQQVAIPVTGLARSPAYQSAIHQVVSEQGHGLMLRLTPEDFEDADELGGALAAIPAFFGLGVEQIDLLLDLGSVAGMSAGMIAQIHRANIELVTNLEQWRTLTVSSAAFPLGLAPLTRDQWNIVPRVDWLAWRALLTGTRQPRRLPAFSDYTIAQPALPADGIATILAQLRYATPEAWSIWKGRNAITEGFDQFFSICIDIFQRDEYRGQDFSWGDAQIAERAASVGSCGNAQTWRQIGTNHHLETVLDQIANLP